MDTETKPRDTSAEETTEFTYGDHPIRRRGDLLNLTSMWVATGRPKNLEPYDWLRFPETKILFDQFRDELSYLSPTGNPCATRVLGADPTTWIIRKRARTGGTWLY
jgi:hypothetical protein